MDSSSSAWPICEVVIAKSDPALARRPAELAAAISRCAREHDAERPVAALFQQLHEFCDDQCAGLQHEEKCTDSCMDVFEDITSGVLLANMRPS